MKKWLYIHALSFSIFIFAFSALHILLPDDKFSELENRYLQKMPVFSVQSLFSSKYNKEVEKYVSDQFPFRNQFVRIKSDLQLMMLKKENNEVFFGKDGYLLEKYKAPDMDLVDNNIKSVNKFCKNNPDIPIFMALIPGSSTVYENKLPLFAKNFDMKNMEEYIKAELDSKINYTSLLQVFENHSNEYIYYKTDHHWTSLGAYLAYRSLSEKMKFSPSTLNDFTIERFNDFYGTYYSKANNRHIKPDCIDIYLPKKEIQYNVNYLDTGTVSNSLYEYKYLDSKDKYSVFLDGNHSLVRIDTKSDSSKNLLIIKDSYTHSLVPFLLPHYKEIHLFDLRYLNLSLSDYIKENHIDEVLILYSTSNFIQDTSVTKLKY